MNIHPVQLYRHTDTQAGLFKVFLINEHFKFSSYSHIKKANHSGIFGSGSLQINSISDLKFVSVKFVIFKGDLELFLYASCCIYYKKRSAFIDSNSLQMSKIHKQREGAIRQCIAQVSNIVEETKKLKEQHEEDLNILLKLRKEQAKVCVIV